MQGLENLGSTCAINSLIQIICRTKDLRSVLLEEDIPSNTLSYELKEILDMMHNQNHSLSPKKFINSVYRFLKGIFKRGEQIDIVELWMFIYNKIAEELGTPLQSIAPKNHVLDDIHITDDIDTISLSQSKELSVHCDSVIQNMNEYKTSLWQDTNQGIFLGILQCKKCNKYIYNFEPFINISLDFCENNDVESVASMFRNYLKQQAHEGDWKCENCNEKTPYTKSLKIWKLPKVIIFTINRFKNARQKNTKPVNINKTLCVKKGSVVTNLNEDITYKATSFGMHYGNLFGGHYCAVCNVDDDYVFYDDLNISIINKENVKKIYQNNRDAYMIVYSL